MIYLCSFCQQPVTYRRAPRVPPRCPRCQHKERCACGAPRNRVNRQCAVCARETRQATLAARRLAHPPQTGYERLRIHRLAQRARRGVRQWMSGAVDHASFDDICRAQLQRVKEGIAASNARLLDAHYSSEVAVASRGIVSVWGPYRPIDNYGATDAR